MVYCADEKAVETTSKTEGVSHQRTIVNGYGTVEG